MPDPVDGIINFFWGVPLFLTISGFLIWFSAERSVSYWSFLKKRFWRIYPELWGGVIICILSIYLTYDTFRPLDMILFALGQGTLFQFWTPDSLRSFGCGTPNGSLWTISVIIQFYLIVWFLRKLLHGKSIRVWAVSFILVLIIDIVGDRVSAILPEMLGKLYGVTFVPFLWMFILGCIVAEFWKEISGLLVRFWWVLILIVVLLDVFSYDIVYLGHYGFLRSSLEFLGLLGFAYHYPALRIKKDISYGVYIYHMIIVNVLIQYGFVNTYWALLLVVVLTLVLAYASSITLGRLSSMRRKRLSALI